MGRTVVYDWCVKEQVEKILHLKETHTGLLIGQRTPQKDTVVYLCPTPVQEEDEDDKKEQPATAKNKSLLHLDEAWVCQHAKEVTRMLPGGIDILGFYTASSTAQTIKLKQELQQILCALLTSLAKDKEWSVHPEITEGILLNITLDFNKYICHTYDIDDPKGSGKPADWKLLSSVAKWHMLVSEMAGDLKFPISREKRHVTVKKQLLLGLSPLFQRIAASVAIVDGVLRDPSENLVLSDSKKSKHKGDSEELSHVVDLLSPLKSKSCPVRSVATDCILMFDCKGTMHLRAFIHGKATVEEAVKAIYQDIVRSITARCEIHCEDLLLIDEEQQDPVVVYELPKRVFAPLVKTGLLICDYQFHGDTAGDSLNAFSELLNLDISEDEVQIYETSPTTSSLIQPCTRDERSGDDLVTPQNVLYPAVGAALFAILFGVVYIYIFRHS